MSSTNRVDTDSQNGDKQCENTGRNKNPPVNCNFIRVILQESIHREKDSRPGNQIWYPDQPHKFMVYQSGYMSGRCPENFPDPNFSVSSGHNQKR